MNQVSRSPVQPDYSPLIRYFETTGSIILLGSAARQELSETNSDLDFGVILYQDDAKPPEKTGCPSIFYHDRPLPLDSVASPWGELHKYLFATRENMLACFGSDHGDAEWTVNLLLDAVFSDTAGGERDLFYDRRFEEAQIRGLPHLEKVFRKDKTQFETTDLTSKMLYHMAVFAIKTLFWMQCLQTKDKKSSRISTTSARINHLMLSGSHDTWLAISDLWKSITAIRGNEKSPPAQLQQIKMRLFMFLIMPVSEAIFRNDKPLN